MTRVVDSELSIPLHDGKHAYGRLREVEGAPVVVMTHGTTGGIFGHPYHQGARVLAEAGFSVYRFGFYASPVDARSTTNVTFDDHVSDLDVVVAHFKALGQKVSVVGHSIGGLATLSSRQQAFDAAVMWDASDPSVIRPSNWPDLWVWLPELGCWRYENGVVSLIDARLVESFTSVDAEAAVASFRKPVKFIAAGDDVCADPARRYYDLARSTKSLHIIDGADHCFTRDNHADELFAETLVWLEEHGR